MEFTEESMNEFIIEKSGLDRGIVEKLYAAELPQDFAEDLSFIFSNIWSEEAMGRLKLHGDKREERAQFLDEHNRKIAKEYSISVEFVREYYNALCQWMRDCMNEIKKVLDQKPKET